MDTLTPREKQVVAAITRWARRFGCWPTIREIGADIAEREGRPSLSVASSFRSLIRKGVIARDARGYRVLAMKIKQSVRLVKV